MLTSLRLRILFLIMLGLGPVLCLFVYNSVEQRRTAAENATTESLRLAKAIAVQKQRLILDTRTLLNSLAFVQAVNSGAPSAECNQVLGELLRQKDGFANLGVVNAEGWIVCSGLPMRTDVNVGDRAYFSRALQSREFAIGDYQIGRVTGVSTINFGFPIFDPQGNPRAVIYAALDLSWLGFLISSMKLPEDAGVVLIDEHRTILARYPRQEGWQGRNVAGSPLAEKIFAADGEGQAGVEGFDGVPRLYGFAPLYEDRGNRVFVAVGIPAGVAFAAANRAFARNLVAVGILALVVLTAAWVFAELFILRTTRALTAAASEWGRGNFEVRTRLPRSNSEFGRLARVFDDMAGHLEERQREVERINRVLRTLSAGNRTLLRATDETTLLGDMCRVEVEIGGYEIAVVYYLQDDARTIAPVSQVGLEEPEFARLAVCLRSGAAHEGAVAVAIRTGELALAKDATPDSEPSRRNPELGLWDCRSLLALPLRVQDRVIGALAIYTRQREAFDRREIELLTENADDLAFGIQVLRQNEQRRKAEKAVERMAYYDALTGLVNRSWFHQLVARSIAAGEKRLSVMVIGIDHFREISRTIGEANGDLLLQAFGPRVSDLLGPDQVLGRLGEDEFALLLPGTGPDDAARLADRMLKILGEPFMVAGLALDIRISIGISHYPEQGSGAEQLLRNAATAMLGIQPAGGACAIYVPQPEPNNTRQLLLIGALRRAIEHSQLALYCQPKIDLSTGAACGAEALLRWPNAEYGGKGGMIYPDEFISLAEHTGLILPLTYWVIEKALYHLSEWEERAFRVPLAVNVSTRNLQDPRFVEEIARAASRWGGTGLLKRLQLELTESALMEDPELAFEVITRLSDMGIDLYIDDFGTGYSSLAYLKRLPVTAIKIDKSFVMDILNNKESVSIVRSTIDLSHDLDRKVVAEGVENGEIYELLKKLGCDEAQGYHISKPMPIEQFPDWLSASRWKPRIRGRTRKQSARA
jgi:diguanylate cyclase